MEKKILMSDRWLRHALAFSVGVLGLGLGGCKVDGAELEKNIKAKLESSGVVVDSVSCPKDRAFKKGDKFTCDGKEKGGADFKVTVEQGDAGSVSWNLEGKYLSVESLQSEMQKVNKDIKLNCKEKAVLVKKGRKLDCETTAGGKTDKVTFTFKDDEGNFDVSGADDAKPAGDAKPADEKKDEPKPADDKPKHDEEKKEGE
ncbi:MAG: DUF4333 domain-containing protein [Polyangiaceae bacterium]